MASTTRTHRRTLLAVASLLLVLAAACGSDDDSSQADTGGGVTTTAASSSDDEYGDTGGDDESSAEEGTIVAKDFSLTDLTVAPGEEIVLENEGDATHTATADDGSFDLGEVEGGATSDPGTAPTTPGDYAFHCEIHPTMTATLTVEG
jgi:plastocyanin